MARQPPCSRARGDRKRQPPRSPVCFLLDLERRTGGDRPATRLLGLRGAAVEMSALLLCNGRWQPPQYLLETTVDIRARVSNVRRGAPIYHKRNLTFSDGPAATAPPSVCFGMGFSGRMSDEMPFAFCGHSATLSTPENPDACSSTSHLFRAIKRRQDRERGRQK